MNVSDYEFIIYVNQEAIYSGSFEEVPDHHRENIVESMEEWGTVLRGRNLNEMIYSLLAWYDEKVYICTCCGMQSDEELSKCSECSGEIVQQYRYERDENLTRLMLCIGMITHVEIN